MVYIVFSIRAVFHRHWRSTGQQGKGGDLLLFHSTTSTRSRTFRFLDVRHLDVATLHVKRLHAFLIITLVLTRLLFNEICHIIELLFEWSNDNAMFVRLIDDLTLVDDLMTWFLLQQFNTQNRCIWTHIDYHPRITSEATNFVNFSESSP